MTGNLRLPHTGNPILAAEYRPVRKLQNCLMVTAPEKNLISVSHVGRELNAFFVTDDVRCACLEKGTDTILYERNMAEGLYSTYDLAWLGIKILDAAPDLLVTPDRSQMIHAYIADTAMEVMNHQVDEVQEARRS